MRLCAVPPEGALVKNLGGSRIYLGGPDVGTEGDAAGFPLDASEAQVITAPQPLMSFRTPAPPGDGAPAVLYARSAQGISKVAFLVAS